MFLHNGRYQDLQHVIEGYKQTSVPLVMHNGQHVMPYATTGGDDIGIYLLIPKLAKFFNLSADQAISLFFYGIIFSSLALGLLGFFLLYKTVWERFVACVGLLISLFLPFAISLMCPK